MLNFQSTKPSTKHLTTIMMVNSLEHASKMFPQKYIGFHSSSLLTTSIEIIYFSSGFEKPPQPDLRCCATGLAEVLHLETPRFGWSSTRRHRPGTGRGTGDVVSTQEGDPKKDWRHGEHFIELFIQLTSVIRCYNPWRIRMYAIYGLPFTINIPQSC